MKRQVLRTKFEGKEKRAVPENGKVSFEPESREGRDMTESERKKIQNLCSRKCNEQKTRSSTGSTHSESHATRAQPVCSD